MSHTFNSKNERAWLKEIYQKRSNRSVEIGKQAIDLLIKKGIPVTYTNIAEQSKEIDTMEKGFILIRSVQTKSYMSITRNIVKLINKKIIAIVIHPRVL
jgi:hypothetical protein